MTKILLPSIYNFLRYGPNPGWMQYDDGIDVDGEGNIVSIGGFPLNENVTYRVGSFQDLHINFGKQTTLEKYFEDNPECLPDHDASIGCHVLLLKLYSLGIWRNLLSILDADGDGEVTAKELKVSFLLQNTLLCQKFG